ncbi:hypothetical protein FIBSPDRAFT_894652 [Athelia psychrophila]|uniref:Uncharacterized protein n=1 Tax=Athelia psychrophila TaxID=1759441 RepID=A0A166FJY5_9AGAM|nr:hypothetical protein FIBSPDRAFT_894652 [Fibularhizoctonia sp. CBS 109695]
MYSDGSLTAKPSGPPPVHRGATFSDWASTLYHVEEALPEVASVYEVEASSSSASALLAHGVQHRVVVLQAEAVWAALQKQQNHMYPTPELQERLVVGVLEARLRRKGEKRGPAARLALPTFSCVKLSPHEVPVCRAQPLVATATVETTLRSTAPRAVSDTGMSTIKIFWVSVQLTRRPIDLPLTLTPTRRHLLEPTLSPTQVPTPTGHLRSAELRRTSLALGEEALLEAQDQAQDESSRGHKRLI